MRAFVIKINVIFYVSFVTFCGISYLCFAENFGSNLVGLWGAVSVLVAGVIFLKCIFNISKDLFGNELIILCLAVNCAMQLPPIICWLSYGENGFELFGLIFSEFTAILIHFFIAGWSLLNIQLFKKCS